MCWDSCLFLGGYDTWQVGREDAALDIQASSDVSALYGFSMEHLADYDNRCEADVSSMWNEYYNSSTYTIL